MFVVHPEWKHDYVCGRTVESLISDTTAWPIVQAQQRPTLKRAKCSEDCNGENPLNRRKAKCSDKI
jgi:hypothetical protein